VGCTVGFAENRVDKVHSTERAGDEGVDRLAPEVDLGVGAAVREHLMVAELTQRKLAVVAVGREILL
jgi:hypothetical protein